MIVYLLVALFVIGFCLTIVYSFKKRLEAVRRTAAMVLFLGLVVVSGWLVSYANRLWVDALLFVNLYQLFNIYRLGFSRVRIDYLQNIGRKTAIRLIELQLLIVLAGSLLSESAYLYRIRWTVTAAVALAVSLILLMSTWRQTRTTKRIKQNTALLDSQAPTLSVAIPARNESDSLYNCLESLIACDYPKLEILVLDDNSSSRRVPEIVKSFAHNGVEFIAGQPIRSGWLAKNWAYEQLLNAANGELILFCGADTRFTPESLRFLVSALLSRKKTMISVLPKNYIASGILPPLVQPLRYMWEISLPRRAFKRPPVLSTCWLSSAAFLRQSGGFAAISNRVVCESYFARLAVKSDGYSFLLYDGVQSEKTYPDQIETAVRLRYPQLHRQPELVALLSIIELILLLGTLPMAVAGLLTHNLWLVVLAVAAFGVYGINFGLVSRITYRLYSPGSIISWPVAVGLDLYLMHLSMWRYEFGKVLWKGRSVAPPVMHQKDTKIDAPV